MRFLYLKTGGSSHSQLSPVIDIFFYQFECKPSTLSSWPCRRRFIIVWSFQFQKKIDRRRFIVQYTIAQFLNSRLIQEQRTLNSILGTQKSSMTTHSSFSWCLMSYISYWVPAFCILHLSAFQEVGLIFFCLFTFMSFDFISTCNLSLSMGLCHCFIILIENLFLLYQEIVNLP